MRMLSWIAVGCSLLGAAGCKGEPFLPDAKIDAPLDAFQQPWLTPAPGVYANWDIQLVAPFDVSAARQLYILDLWAVSPGGTITYDDSSTVNVPAGMLAGAIDTLHARDTKVFCYMRAGSVHLTKDPDASKFPGFKASPPDKPDAPEAGSVIGWTTRAMTADERWLDLGAGHDTVLAIVQKRIAFADSIGCDGVVVDGNDRYATDSGWGEVPYDDQVAWQRENAQAAHALNIAIGARNGYLYGFSSLAGDGTGKANYYDFAVAESCVVNDDCGDLQPYPAIMKAVFAIEYSDSPDQRCSSLANLVAADGVIKMAGKLDGSYAQTCAIP